ncbi:hypothetical protein K438DRAFT_800641 [Mycena galopus ATCC 62051]|nr:hypothetical protein K438DRAFT_800641 [Mycena galopus ATCC 62051]
MRCAQPLRSKNPPASRAPYLRPCPHCHAPAYPNGRSSSPAPPSWPSHPPPASTLLTARGPQQLRQRLSTAHATFVASLGILPSSAPSQSWAANLAPAGTTAGTTNTTRTPCTSPAATVSSGAPPSSQSRVKCEYGTHHHQHMQHHPRHFRPVPACAPNLPHRSALADQLPRLHVLLQSQQHLHAQRIPRTFSTVRAARCTHRIRPPRRSSPLSHRQPPTPPVCSTRTAAGDPPAALCAPHAMRPWRTHERMDTRRSRCSSSGYAVRRNQDTDVLPLRARGGSGCLSGTPTHRKRARQRGEGLLTAGLLVPTDLAFHLVFLVHGSFV